MPQFHFYEHKMLATWASYSDGTPINEPLARHSPSWTVQFSYTLFLSVPFTRGMRTRYPFPHLFGCNSLCRRISWGGIEPLGESRSTPVQKSETLPSPASYSSALRHFGYARRHGINRPCYCMPYPLPVNICNHKCLSGSAYVYIFIYACLREWIRLESSVRWGMRRRFPALSGSLSGSTYEGTGRACYRWRHERPTGTHRAAGRLRREGLRRRERERKKLSSLGPREPGEHAVA